MAKLTNSKGPKRPSLPPRLPKKPVSGMQSWMVVGLIIAIASMFLLTKQTTLQSISQKQFESMLLQKEV